MKKAVIISLIVVICAFAQCLGGPLNGRIGIKTGFNYGIFDPEEDDNNLSGMGFHFGLGMGIDVFNTLAIDITPTFRTTKYGRTDEILGTDVTSSISYTNLYLPLQVSLKVGSMPVVSPYIGLGAAGNFQMSGTVRFESNGTSFEDEIDSEDLEQDFFLIGALGTEIKLIKASIVPEVSINYNLTPSLVDEENPNNEVDGTNIDFHFSVGFYLSL
jgi:hypothetical protein